MNINIFSFCLYLFFLLKPQSNYFLQIKKDKKEGDFPQSYYFWRFDYIFEVKQSQDKLTKRYKIAGTAITSRKIK